MQRFIIALVIAVTAVSGGAGWAMPIGRDHAQPNAIIAVADKCGFNRYRDANGVCRRAYQMIRPRKQLYSSCGGLNAHRVCNFTGQCWMVCD